MRHWLSGLKVMHVKLVSLHSSDMLTLVLALPALNHLVPVRLLNVLPEMKLGQKPALAFRTGHRHLFSVVTLVDVFVQVLGMSEQTRTDRAVMTRNLKVNHANVEVEHAGGVKLFLAAILWARRGFHVRGDLKVHSE